MIKKIDPKLYAVYLGGRLKWRITRKLHSTQDKGRISARSKSLSSANAKTRGMRETKRYIFRQLAG